MKRRPWKIGEHVRTPVGEGGHYGIVIRIRKRAPRTWTRFARPGADVPTFLDVLLPDGTIFLLPDTLVKRVRAK